MGAGEFFLSGERPLVDAGPSATYDPRMPYEPRKPPRRRAGPAFGPANFLAFALALGAIASGYIRLDDGSVIAAPLLLVLGYVVLLPASLLLGWRRIGGDR